MKKNIVLLFGIIVFILGGCSLDDDSEPSHKDINWFCISDEPGDPFRHLIYEVYAQTGIPIFCNDTIGSQVEIDRNGNPFRRYEVLCVNYTLTSNSETAQYELEHDKNNLESGIRLMRDTMFPRLPKAVHMHSCFLVKSLNVYKLGDYEPIEAYCGFNTFVIGGMGRIARMSPDERFDLAMTALSILMSNYMVKDTESDLEAFYAVSNSINFTGKTPNDIYSDWIDYGDSDPQAWEALGFLGYDRAIPGNPIVTFMPYSKAKDLQTYISAYLRMSESDFTAKYQSRRYILEKYQILKDVLGQLYARE